MTPKHIYDCLRLCFSFRSLINLVTEKKHFSVILAKEPD